MRRIGDIGIWENAVPDELCAGLIDWFEDEYVMAKYRNEDSVTDTYKFLYDVTLRKMFAPILRDCGDEYFQLYGHSTWRKQCRPLTMKVQKTKPGEKGYQGIHWEQGEGILSAPRFAAWMAYLNDVPHESGARTVFPLQQRISFRPERGRMLIWPAAYTHPHHAFPALSGDTPKYIITGWFEYKIPELTPSK